MDNGYVELGKNAWTSHGKDNCHGREHFCSQTEAHAGPQFEPELRHTTNEPKGVLQKNLKTFVYLGAALLVIVAAIFSSTGKKTPAQQAAKRSASPTHVADNTDNNVQDLKNQLQAQRQKEQQQALLLLPRRRSCPCVCTSAQRTAPQRMGRPASPHLAKLVNPAAAAWLWSTRHGEKQLSPEQQQASRLPPRSGRARRRSLRLEPCLFSLV